jgi:heme oxygenase
MTAHLATKMEQSTPDPTVHFTLAVDSPIVAPPVTPMHQLRCASRSSHDRIERALPSFDSSLTRARYISVLRAFYGFYAPLEPLCDARRALPARRSTW